MIESLKQFLLEQGLSDEMTAYISWIILAIGVIILAWIANYVARQILLTIIQRIVKRSKTKWDDALLENKVFTRMSHFAPAMVFYFSAPLFDTLAESIERLSMVYMILVAILVVNSFLNSVNTIYQSYDVSRNRPVKGYVQVAKILFSVFLIIIAIATLMDRSPIFFLSGIGAMTAVLLLVFKDTILGLVASIQLSMNDMVRIGDWIEMPKYGADGDVIDITLHTVMVQNWDKTITTIPAYALISDSFKNWRGMDESGGRRIKRSILIDITTIKLCTEEMLNRYEKYQFISDYVKSKRIDVAKHNKEKAVDQSELVNGRRMTNVGTYRAYVKAYLNQHPMIHKGMTFLIRQLPPSPEGLPLELYVFSSDQRWVNYEEIQADIFDHLLAVLPEFELRVFQNPTGSDFRSIKSN